MLTVVTLLAVQCTVVEPLLIFRSRSRPSSSCPTSSNHGDTDQNNDADAGDEAGVGCNDKYVFPPHDTALYLIIFSVRGGGGYF